jgi:predicted metal-dependent hydrolase
MGIALPLWGIKRMKTKWGTCNIEARRTWLNLELIKKPPQCLEYIIVHELVHFLERHRNERLVGLMESLLQQWRFYRKELNATPLSHEDWLY